MDRNVEAFSAVNNCLMVAGLQRGSKFSSRIRADELGHVSPAGVAAEVRGICPTDIDISGRRGGGGGTRDDANGNDGEYEKKK